MAAPQFLGIKYLKWGVQLIALCICLFSLATLGEIRFPFDEGGGVEVIDSASGLSGDIIGAQFSSNAVVGSHSILLDGSSYITVEGDPLHDITEAVTLSVWANISDINRHQSIISRNNSYYIISRKSSDGARILFGLRINGAWTNIKLPKKFSISENTWTHFAAVYNGEKMRLYIDGVERESKNQSGFISRTSKPLQIGSIWGSWYFYGHIDEVTVYDSALTASEIAALSTLQPLPVSSACYADLPTFHVTSSSELTNAIDAATDTGAVVEVASGSYPCLDISKKHFTQDKPLILRGSRDGETIFKAGHDGFSRCTYALKLHDTQYVQVQDISVQGGLDSIGIETSNHIVIDQVSVSKPRQAGIHIHKNSSDIDITRSDISNTGLLNPQWGECIYVGTGGRNYFPDQTERVWIEGNTISYCGNGEAINIKPEVFDSTVRGNTIHDIRPGANGQYNHAAITVEGSNRSPQVGHEHRSGDSRNIWLEDNIISRVFYGTFRDFATGIMVSGTGVSVVDNSISDFDEYGIYINGYGDLGLPVHLQGNTVTNSSGEKARQYSSSSDVREDADIRGLNTLQAQSWPCH